MFVLDKSEFEAWRSQFVTSKSDRKGLRYPPMAFTEQGVAMLSSVLNSQRAVQVNIAYKINKAITIQSLVFQFLNGRGVARLQSFMDGEREFDDAMTSRNSLWKWMFFRPLRLLMKRAIGSEGN